MNPSIKPTLIMLSVALCFGYGLFKLMDVDDKKFNLAITERDAVDVCGRGDLANCVRYRDYFLREDHWTPREEIILSLDSAYYKATKSHLPDKK